MVCFPHISLALLQARALSCNDERRNLFRLSLVHAHDPSAGLFAAANGTFPLALCVLGVCGGSRTDDAWLRPDNIPSLLSLIAQVKTVREACQPLQYRLTNLLPLSFGLALPTLPDVRDRRDALMPHPVILRVAHLYPPSSVLS